MKKFAFIVLSLAFVSNLAFATDIKTKKGEVVKNDTKKEMQIKNNQNAKKDKTKMQNDEAATSDDKPNQDEIIVM